MGEPIRRGPETVLDALRSRRSVRAFQDTPVPRAKIEQILDAASDMTELALLHGVEAAWSQHWEHSLWATR